MLDKITAYLKEWHMLEAKDNVIAGISGGADSICLLFVLHKLSSVFLFHITAVHVNHGLRGEEAKKDELFVKQLCGKLGIPCVIYSKDVREIAKQRRRSEEETGRDVRREVFAEAMTAYGGTKIALAHHQNDNVETMLMNLARGTGLRGLGGMRPVNKEVIRPLLCVTRAEIEAFLAEHQIAYCEDATNQSDLYTRNRIRSHVVPYLEEQVNQGAVKHIADSMERLRSIQEYLDQQVENWYQNCIRPENQDIILIGDVYAYVPEALKPLLLQRIITEMAEAQRDISASHLKAADRLLSLQNGRQLNLPYGIIAARCYEGLCFSRKEEVSKLFEPILLPENGRIEVDGREIRSITLEVGLNRAKSVEKHYTKQFDYDIIKSNVSIRTRKAGDYIIIDDQGNRQKLKAFFINNKVPKKARDQILLIADGSHILWIIGMRRSMAGRPNEYTKKILQIEIMGTSEDENGGNN